MSDQYVYSPIDFCADCFAAGFRVGGGLVYILAIAGAESGFDPKATNTAGNSPPSTDRGIVQINSYWHPEVLDVCAFDTKCAAVQAFRISKNGTDFSAWATFVNGAYKNYLHVAWMAIDAYQRIQKELANESTLNAQVASVSQQLAVAQGNLTNAQAQIAQLQTQISQLQSGDQKTMADLQKQLSDMTALRDAAVSKSETLQGSLTQLQGNVTAWINSLRTQLLGSE